MKPGVFREEYIAIILRELLRGLSYLHTEGKLHRDIKGLSQGLTRGMQITNECTIQPLIFYYPPLERSNWLISVFLDSYPEHSQLRKIRLSERRIGCHQR